MITKDTTAWGGYPKRTADVVGIRQSKDILPYLLKGEFGIPRGNGRSYGDAALAPIIWHSLHRHHLLAFDATAGILTAEAGVLLQDILEFIVPKGWFLPVTPGTRYITLGGAVAADVHGKNHHAQGGFGDWVLEFHLLTEAGKIMVCSPTENSKLFYLTLGGMGLTGFILQVSFQLIPIQTAFIQQQNYKAPNLEILCDLLETHHHATYSVAWTDCIAGGKHLGRSVLMIGEHALELPKSYANHNPLNRNLPGSLSIPAFAPAGFLNKLNIQIFNELYYYKSGNKSLEHFTPLDAFFYPLDRLLNWNRLYGKAGFVQYQMVVPKDQGRKALRDILTYIQQSKFPSFLAVLKTMGSGTGVLSFPIEGYTLALDFPIRPGLLAWMEELDKRVIEYGGRVYLAKDARMSAESFQGMYGNAATIFRQELKRFAPQGIWQSDLSRRLGVSG